MVHLVAKRLSFLTRLVVIFLGKEGDGVANGLEQRVGHVAAKSLSAHNTQDCQVLSVCRKGIRGHEPASLAQFVRQVKDGKVGLVGAMKGKHWNVGPIRDAVELWHFLDMLRQMQGNKLRASVDAVVPVKTKTQEVVILGNDLISWTTKIEGKVWHETPEIIAFKNEVVGEIVLFAPNGPSHARVHEPVFVAACVDTLNSWQPEIPHKVRLQKRRHETTRRSVLDCEMFRHKRKGHALLTTWMGTLRPVSFSSLSSISDMPLTSS